MAPQEEAILIRQVQWLTNNRNHHRRGENYVGPLEMQLISLDQKVENFSGSNVEGARKIKAST